MKESKILTRTYLIPYVGNLDLTLKCLVDNERVNKWELVKCDSHLLKDYILFVLVFERDIDPSENKIYENNCMNEELENYIREGIKKFREVEKRLNEEFINKVKSDEYENTPDYITSKINEAIDNLSLVIFKNDITFVPHYAYSEYMNNKGIHIEEPKQITDFIHAVVKLVGKETSAYDYAFYREMAKWNDDKYKVYVEGIENETYIHIIYFKPLTGPKDDIVTHIPIY
jgi:hypothetical protein